MSTVTINESSLRWGMYRLAYEIHGDGAGGPTIVFMHGLLFDRLCNRPLARRLADLGHRVVLLDLLGHGESDKPAHASQYRLDVYADQVVALLDHLGLERAVIGGTSLGTGTSLYTAVRYPDRVAALIFDSPTLERGMPAVTLQLAPQLLQTQYLPWLSNALAGVARRLPRIGWGPLDSLFNMLSLEPKGAAAVMHGMLVGPVTPTAAERRAVTAPALVLGHGHDVGHPWADAANLAKMLPNARIERTWPIEVALAPGRMAERINAFLGELDLHEEAQRPVRRVRAVR